MTYCLYRAFVRACIAKRREHSIRVTMPGGMYGQGRKEVERSRPQLTTPLDLEQPDPANSRDDYGWGTAELCMNVNRQVQINSRGTVGWEATGRCGRISHQIQANNRGNLRQTGNVVAKSITLPNCWINSAGNPWQLPYCYAPPPPFWNLLPRKEGPLTQE